MSADELLAILVSAIARADATAAVGGCLMEEANGRLERGEGDTVHALEDLVHAIYDAANRQMRGRTFEDLVSGDVEAKAALRREMDEWSRERRAAGNAYDMPLRPQVAA